MRLEAKLIWFVFGVYVLLDVGVLALGLSYTFEDVVVDLLMLGIAVLVTVLCWHDDMRDRDRLDG